MKAIVAFSGGLDSTVLAYQCRDLGYAIRLVSFDYGQRHRKEIKHAKSIAQLLQARHDIIDLTGLGKFLTGSSLTDAIAVPDGHYAAETMRITVVPNRNAIMLAALFGIGVADESDYIAIANHAGDHFIYPDCKPEFIGAFAAMQAKALEGISDCQLLAPFMSITKDAIVSIGDSLRVPFEKTWSCYKGGDLHCGTCGTCTERIEAFELSGVADPTAYEWKISTDY